MRTAHPSLISKLLALFGQKRPDDPQSHYQGERDTTLTLSEEPTAREVARVAAEKQSARSGRR